MKQWTGLKFVSEIYNGLCTFFGANADETTEAELHHQLLEAGTLSEIRANALNEANDAVKQQMHEFQTRLEALQGQISELQTDASNKAAKIGDLETQLETLNGQLSEKDKEIGVLKEQNTSLSGQVASLKAGKPIDKDAPPDASKPVTQTPAPNGGVVVSSSALQQAFDKISAKSN